jgi:hypothetical protein
MWMRTTDLPITHVEVVVHQQDERIGERERVRRDHWRRRMSWSREAGCERGHVDDARDSTLEWHVLSFLSVRPRC